MPPEPANETWFRENWSAATAPETEPEPVAPRPASRTRRSKPETRPTPERRLVATPASDIKVERTEWLWPGRISLGDVTLLSGVPGLGKSMFTAWLAAQNSVGGLGREPGVTLMATAEDSPARTVVPRLKAWEADLSRVRFLEIIEGAAGEEVPDGISLPADTDTVREVAATVGATLLIIDPLMAHLDASVDSYRDHAVRHALKPLYYLAKDLGCAVLALLHLNKNPGGDPLQRIGGSTGLPAAARSALLLARDPDDPDGEQGSRRILAHIKCNVAPEAPSLLYEIEPILIPATATEPEVETARIEHRGESELTGRELLGPPSKDGTSRLEEAEEFLREALAGGPRSSREVKAAAENAAISPKTLRRARERLGVADQREPTGHTTWQLPPAHEPRAHGLGAQGSGGTGGHEGVSPLPEPFVPLRDHVGTETPVPLSEEGHEAASGPPAEEGTSLVTEALSDEQLAAVLARYPEIDVSGWPEHERRTYAQTLIANETNLNGGAT